MEAIRPLSAAEHAEVRAASALAQRIARRTPYHDFIAARDRFRESFQQFAAESSESSEARLRRATAALLDLCSVVTSHANAWEEFVAECAGDASGIGDACAAWTAHPAFGFAQDAVVVNSGPLIAAADGQPVFEVDGSAVAIEVWLRAVEIQAVFIADAAFQAVENSFKSAASLILGLSSEVLSGAPVLMAPPGDAATLKLDIGTLDVESVRAADGLMLSARSMAIDLRKGPGSDAASGVTPAEPVAEPVETPGAAEEQAEEQAPVPLPELQVRLRDVAAAIASSVDGLASQWARRFDEEEFLKAVEHDKALVASLVQPIVRSLQKDEDAALSAGGSAPTLPGYPVALPDLGGWLEEHREDAAAVALLVTLPAYLESMEQVTFARAFSFGKGGDFIEFDPFRTTTMHRQAKLLAELADASEGEDESERLRTAIYLCSRLGLPEAQLLYASRYLSQLRPNLSGALAPARDALDNFAAGGPTALSEQVLLADALTREIDGTGESNG